MRMWMVDETKMCRKHLLGEHVETHMLLGTLKRKKSISGYIKNKLIQPLSIKERHDKLSKELNRRGYNHRSELDFSNDIIKYLKEEELNFKVNSENSLNELITRCPECRKNFFKGVKNDNQKIRN